MDAAIVSEFQLCQVVRDNVSRHRNYSSLYHQLLLLHDRSHHSCTQSITACDSNKQNAGAMDYDDK